MNDMDNVFFKKDNYYINWLNHMDYLKHEIEFRDDYRWDSLLSIKWI
ncbi:hypothetical protein [Cetobacterium sp.]